MNLREAENDPLQSAGLDARRLLRCRPGLLGVLKGKGRGTVTLLQGGASAPRRNVNRRDLDPNSGQPPRSLVAGNLEGSNSIWESWNRSTSGSGPGVPQAAPLHTCFLVPLLTTPVFSSQNVLICVINYLVTYLETVLEFYAFVQCDPRQVP